MPWNENWPIGSASVRANQPTGQQNTTYIQSTLRNDHYYNEDATKDGYHKKASMPNFGSTPGIPAGSNGVYYVLTNGSEQEARYTTGVSTSFHLNIWTQQLRGTFSTLDAGTNVTIVSGIPTNAIGEIIIFRRNSTPFIVQSGQFASDNVAAPGNTVHAFSNLLVLASGNGTDSVNDKPILLNNNPNPNVIRGKPSHTDYANIEFEYLINYRII
jgi:hypothetical protein